MATVREECDRSPVSKPNCIRREPSQREHRCSLAFGSCGSERLLNDGGWHRLNLCFHLRVWLRAINIYTAIWASTRETGVGETKGDQRQASSLFSSPRAADRMWHGVSIAPPTVTGLLAGADERRGRAYSRAGRFLTSVGERRPRRGPHRPTCCLHRARNSRQSLPLPMTTRGDRLVCRVGRWPTS